MAYRPPNAFTKHVFNPLAMRFGISGTKKLAVPRRRSGGMQEVPIIVIEQEGGSYLVSPRGETDWVRNLRAADGQCEIAGVAHVAHELPVPERPPVLDRYQQVAGKVVAPHFTALPDPADHPVFKLD